VRPSAMFVSPMLGAPPAARGGSACRTQGWAARRCTDYRSARAATAQNLKTLALRILGPAPARGHELVQAGAPETFQMVVCTENSVRVDYTNLRSRPSTMISACAGRSHRGFQQGVDGIDEFSHSPIHRCRTCIDDQSLLGFQDGDQSARKLLHQRVDLSVSLGTSKIRQM
jgi:hypothetical protein